MFKLLRPSVWVLLELLPHSVLLLLYWLNRGWHVICIGDSFMWMNSTTMQLILLQPKNTSWYFCELMIVKTYFPTHLCYGNKGFSRLTCTCAWSELPWLDFLCSCPTTVGRAGSQGTLDTIFLCHKLTVVPPFAQSTPSLASRVSSLKKSNFHRTNPFKTFFSFKVVFTNNLSKFIYSKFRKNNKVRQKCGKTSAQVSLVKLLYSITHFGSTPFCF